MTPTQKVQVEQSTNRSAIAAILDKPETDRAETWQTDLDGLTKRAQSLELELRAALAMGDETEEEEDEETTTTETKEETETRELFEGLEFSKYIAAAMSGRGVADGQEAEYNTEQGLAMDQFPLELLTRDDDMGDLETRAKVDGEGKTNQGTWIDRLFADTAAKQLGVTFPSVGPGVAAYPVTTGGGDSAQRGRAEAQGAGTYAYSVTELKPTRRAVRAIYSIEDAARMPGFADAIGRDMRMAMTEQIDQAIFKGDSGANENTADITGLTTAGITEVTLTQANKVKGLKWIELFAALLDGKHAASMADVSMIMSVGANQMVLSTRENSAVDNETMAAFLRANGVSWGVRGEIETATTNGKFGAFMGLKRGQAGTAVAPVWMGATLIRDPYTGASKGEVDLTLSYLWNFGIPRVSNYRRLKFVS